MRKLKHTPGPWIYDDGDNGKFFPSVYIGPEKHKHYGSITINVSHDQEQESIEANAKLIAAAPDLLEVVIYASECLDFKDHPQVLKELKAAIKKATK